jgi:hypothetical protein
MGETELIAVIRDADAQYGLLFGQIITINFAMIVAIYYFLHRAPLLFRIAAFSFYSIGMLTLIGFMLLQSTLKLNAMEALQALPSRSRLADIVLGVHESSLAKVTAFFFNVSVWALFVVIAYLLFWWRGDPERAPTKRTRDRSMRG